MMKKTVLVLLLVLTMCLGLCASAGAEVYEVGNHPSHMGNDCLVCNVASLLLALPDADALTDEQVKEAARLINHIDSIKFDLEGDEYEELFVIVGQGAFDNYDALKEKINYGWLVVTKKVLGITDEDMSQTQVAFNIEKTGDASFGTQMMTLSEAGSSQAMTFTAGTEPGELGTATYMLPVGSYRISEVDAPMLIDGAWVDTAYATYNGQRADSMEIEVFPGEGSPVEVMNVRPSDLKLITKIAGNEDQASGTYTYEITVTNSNAPDEQPSEEEDPEHSSGYWVWFVTSTEATVSENANADGGGYYYVPSGEPFTVTMQPGTLKVISLLDGTTYTITKVEEAEGSSEQCSLQNIVYPPENAEQSDVTVSGEIDRMYGNSFEVTYTYNVHDWQYALHEDDETIIEKICSNCEKVDGSITISAPENLKYDGQGKAAIVSGKIDGESPTVVYTKDGEPFDGTPKHIGEYTASITWGDVTASVSYTIDHTEHNLTYRPNEDKKTHVSVCECGYTGENEPHSFSKNGSGEWACICEVKAVAMVDEQTAYGTFEEAVSAWLTPEASKLTLLDDVSGTAHFEMYSNNGANKILDLNGKTMTTAARALTVNGGVTLTIQDSGTNGTIQYLGNGESVDLVYVMSGATLNLTGGKLYNVANHRYGIGAFASSTLNISGGEIVTPYGICIAAMGQINISGSPTFQSWGAYGDGDYDPVFGMFEDGSVTIKENTNIPDEGWMIYNYEVPYGVMPGKNLIMPDGVVMLTDAANGAYVSALKQGEAAYIVEHEHAMEIFDVDQVAKTVFALCECGHSFGSVTWTLPDNLTYDGTAKGLSVSKTDGMEYALNYGETGSNPPVDAGEYTAELTVSYGEATYGVEVGYSILPAMIELWNVEDIHAQVYTGQALTPPVTVILNDKTLKLGEDYTVVYENNTMSGTATASVTGMGNYGGEVQKEFSIVSAPSDLTAETYLGETKKGTFTYGDVITIRGAVTVAKPSTFSLRSAPAANQVALYLEGGDEVIAGPVTADSMTGEFELTYNTAGKDIAIGQKNLALAYVSDGNKQDTVGSLTVVLNKKSIMPVSAEAEDREYAPGNQTVSVTAVTLDGIISGDTVSVKGLPLTGTIASDVADTYTSVTLPQLELEDKDDAAFYTVSGTTAETNVTISPKVVTAPAITLDRTSFVYDGEEKEPAVIEVKDGENVIPAGEYAVAYSDNVNAGTATVTITDVEGGNYTVSGSTTFAITQANTAMTAQTEKNAYIYGDVITVIGTAVAPKQEEKTFNLLRLIEPTAQQVALYDAAGNQLTDGVSVKDGAYSITYDTKAKMITPAEEIILTVGYVGDANMSDQQAQTNVFTLTAKQVEPVLAGTVSKAYDGMTTVPQNHSLVIELDGKMNDDIVNVSGSFAYEDAAVGTNKTINASGIVLSGDDAEFYILSVNTASSMVGTIHKAKLTAVTPPAGQTLDIHCADAAMVAAQLPETLPYAIENGGTIDLAISWTCDNYDTTPKAQNTFAWTVNDPENLANYEPASGVAVTGSITVTNTNALPVNLIGTDRRITYDGSMFDVSALFAIDENAGVPSYEVVAGGTGEGTLSGSMLNITKAGTFSIKLCTAASGVYAEAEVTAVLTVDKGTPAVTSPTGLTAVYAQILSEVALPADEMGTWGWVNGAASVGNAGIQTHKAVFTPNDLNLWNTVTIDVAIHVVQSATDLTGEGLNHADGQYVYGEDIVITLQAEASGNAAVPMLRSALTPPQARQMALYQRVADQADVQITNPVSAENGLYTLTLHTVDKQLAIGESTLVAKYVGDANAANSEMAYTVTIARKPLTLSDVTANDRYFKAGNKTVEITGAKLSGMEAGDDVKIGGMLTGMISSDVVGVYTNVALEEIMLAGVDSGWYTVEGGEFATSVSILELPADGLETRVVIKEAYTDEDVKATDLGKLPELDTVAEIEAQLRLNIAQYGALTESAVLYDVILEYLEADGTWRRADKDHFPAGGIEVTLPVVKGTTPASHTYTVAHMFTMNMRGHSAGEVEYPKATAYQNEKGEWMLKFTVTGMSPMMVAATPIPSTDVLPQTGDHSNVMLYAMMLTISVIGLAMAKKRRTE